MEKIRVAVLDLYNGKTNDGISSIKKRLDTYFQLKGVIADIDFFDVRRYDELPDLSYHIYISSGGPGSPLSDPESVWEAHYFQFIDALFEHNNFAPLDKKKYLFLICHSFQLVCRHFDFGVVCKRDKESLGMLPIESTEVGMIDPVFRGLGKIFYAKDNREYQVIKPNVFEIERLNAKILALENEHLGDPDNKALMAIRFSPEIVGTQFHPESNAETVRVLLMSKDKEQIVIAERGEEYYENMLKHLDDADKINHTYNVILPNFLDAFIAKKQ